MKKEKKLQIQTILKIRDNSQFLFFENYIISIMNIQYNNQLHFYNIKNFKREFALKDKRNDIFLNNFQNFKLFYAKNKDLYLIAYTFNLAIFKLKIKERKIEKIAFFNCYSFFEDLKNYKLYINNNNSIIVYDILTNTSIQKNLKEIANISDKILLIDNYIFIISFQQVYKWTFMFYCTILDKNMDKFCLKSIFPDIYFDLEDLPALNETFIPISDNYFYINFQIDQNITLVNIAEISIKGKENLIKLGEKNDKKLEDIGVVKRHKIEIKDMGDLTFYPFNNEKFGINIANRNIYEFKIKGMELIAVYILNSYVLNEKLLLINSKEEKEKLKLYLGNKKKMLVFSS